MMNSVHEELCPLHARFFSISPELKENFAMSLIVIGDVFFVSLRDMINGDKWTSEAYSFRNMLRFYLQEDELLNRMVMWGIEGRRQDAN